MTLNLKLVRHHDGKWTALTPEKDEIAPVSGTERKSAPIDPAQLLKALDSLLSADGGIKSVEDVPRLASLMKKFSKKLVSRCVYCNVLQATKAEILSEYLDKGGWETINTWLQYAKSSSSESFLIEMLKLCKELPMTLNRLRENDTAKVIKSLTKHEHSEVKELSSEVVNRWMSIIKEKKSIEPSGEKKKRKDKPEKKSKEKNKTPKETKTSPKHTQDIPESPKGPLKMKGVKRSSIEKEVKPAEIYEDVKIDPEPLMPQPKKPRPDRPKTAKIYQKKFRATGLEEETPLPKNLAKKNTTTVDKTAAVAAAKSALKLNTSPIDRITEKKIKPESLMAIHENANTKGIKLIPAKPRPTYILHESASFMDALISQPVVPIKRKKKVPPKSSTSPTSPPITAPKLQFYKDTLEEKMSEENKTDESEKKEAEDKEIENSSEIDNSTNSEETIQMEITEEGGHTPPNEELKESSKSPEQCEFNDEVPEKKPFDPNNLQSILSHGKRRGKKKSVRWVEDSHIKEILYFEMDDTERVNVSRNQNFYDLKFIEMRREREAMELAKRQIGDRAEEFRMWWDAPILVEAPPPLVIPGCQSQEKQSEIIRQQSTLQEIYFTKEMIPDSPHEPDLEIVAQKEPKIIPLDEENLISTLNDYSNYKPIKPSLPEILSTLMKINTSQASPPVTQNTEPIQVPMETEPVLQPPLIMDPMSQQNIPVPLSQPVPDLSLVNINGFLGQPPLQFNSPPDVHMSEMPGEWVGPPPDLVPNEFFPAFPGPINQNIPQELSPPIVNMRGRGGNGFRPNFRGGPRGMPSQPRRSRILCRHFAAGHCRYEMNCTFLHPGVNGPPL